MPLILFENDIQTGGSENDDTIEIVPRTDSDSSESIQFQFTFAGEDYIREFGLTRADAFNLVIHILNILK